MRMQICYYNDISFDRFVAIMAHEMIHQLEIIDPIEKYHFYIRILSQRFGKESPYKSHDKFFIKEMNRINEQFNLDVDVTEKMSENEFKKISNEVQSLSSIIDETIVNELSEDVITLAKRIRKNIKNDGTTFVKADKKGVHLYIF